MRDDTALSEKYNSKAIIEKLQMEVDLLKRKNSMMDTELQKRSSLTDKPQTETQDGSSQCDLVGRVGDSKVSRLPYFLYWHELIK